MISVITTFYNAEEFIIDCINSVRASKNYPKIEHILINDGSTDSSIDLIKEYESQNLKIINSKKIGRGSALRLGIKNAKFDLICILDADDIINPLWLDLFFSKEIRSLIKINDNHAFFGDNVVFHEKDKNLNSLHLFSTNIGELPKYSIFNPSRIFLYNPIAHLGVIFKKSSNKNLIYSDNLQSQLDWDLWFKFIKLNKQFIHINAVSGFKRIHDLQAFEKKKHLRYTMAGILLQSKWTINLRPHLLPLVIPVIFIRLLWSLLPRVFRTRFH